MNRFKKTILATVIAAGVVFGFTNAASAAVVVPINCNFPGSSQIVNYATHSYYATSKGFGCTADPRLETYFGITVIVQRWNNGNIYTTATGSKAWSQWTIKVPNFSTQSTNFGCRGDAMRSIITYTVVGKAMAPGVVAPTPMSWTDTSAWVNC